MKYLINNFFFTEEEMYILMLMVTITTLVSALLSPLTSMMHSNGFSRSLNCVKKDQKIFFNASNSLQISQVS